MRQSGGIPLANLEQCEAFTKLMYALAPIDICGYQYQIVQVEWDKEYGGSARVIPIINSDKAAS